MLKVEVLNTSAYLLDGDRTILVHLFSEPPSPEVIRFLEAAIDAVQERNKGLIEEAIETLKPLLEDEECQE